MTHSAPACRCVTRGGDFTTDSAGATCLKSPAAWTRLANRVTSARTRKLRRQRDADLLTLPGLNALKIQFPGSQPRLKGFGYVASSSIVLAGVAEKHCATCWFGHRNGSRGNAAIHEVYPQLQGLRADSSGRLPEKPDVPDMNLCGTRVQGVGSWRRNSRLRTRPPE